MQTVSLSKCIALCVNLCMFVGQRCSHDHLIYALTCSGALTVRRAIFNYAWYSKPRTDDGADGTPSNSTLLEEFMSAAVNQAELCAWRERLAAQVRAELHMQPGHLGAPGAAHAVIS